MARDLFRAVAGTKRACCVAHCSVSSTIPAATVSPFLRNSTRPMFLLIENGSMGMAPERPPEAAFRSWTLMRAEQPFVSIL